MKSFAFLQFLTTIVVCAAPWSTLDDIRQGHSHFGQAYDSGPREKPWVIEGIGEAHLPISTKNPEVQKWFDQGNALLHSFWYYEAERSFRWAHKLEPENPMVFWGLARATTGERAKDFIREAQKRRSSATDRERLYIDALAAQLLPNLLKEPGDDSYEGGSQDSRRFLETLCVKYPDDLEARSLLALANMGGDRYGAELMIREILSKRPNHPGAHHYRIHNWDYHEPEQALDSSRLYGQLVPGIGHALHMPGHIFSIVGMWNEAAISMDAATRAEKKYMKDSLTFPFNNWNYGHNRYYLSFIQEQLGMPEAAIFGSRQLIEAPGDPQDNNDNPSSFMSYGLAGLSRALLRFERWDELLKPGNIPWRDAVVRDKFNKAYFEARARFARGETEKAEKAIAAHAELKAEAEKEKGMRASDLYAVQATELRARLAIAKGDTIRGLSLLADAAQAEAALQRRYADPPVYPQALYSALGEEYLKAKSPGLAIEAFNKALDLTKNDIFALSGLVRAYVAAGDRTKASEAMGQLMYVAADAEPDLPILQRAKAAGVQAAPRPAVPRPERNYIRTSLEKYGPNKWEPYSAPELSVKDATGKTVSLSEYKGKNVMVVFYLGEECPHCMRQLHDIARRKDDWERLDTVLLAVSSAEPKKNAAGLKAQGELPFRLLSDDRHVNARRFHSYDDFEDLELHSTILIDREGRVYWARFGGDPFTDIDFLTKQIERMNGRLQSSTQQPARSPASAGGQ